MTRARAPVPESQLMALGIHHDVPASTAPTPPDRDRPIPALEPRNEPAGRHSTYFVHSIGGHCYGAWYTRLADGRVEVFTRTKIRTALVGRLSVEEEARRLLEEIVRDSGDALIDSEVLAMTHRDGPASARG